MWWALIEITVPTACHQTFAGVNTSALYTFMYVHVCMYVNEVVCLCMTQWSEGKIRVSGNTLSAQELLKLFNVYSSVYQCVHVYMYNYCSFDTVLIVIQSRKSYEVGHVQESAKVSDSNQ